MNDQKNVPIIPPIKPSQVFLGDSLIRGVLPKKNPKKYAKQSLAITVECGKKNQKKPL